MKNQDSHIALIPHLFRQEYTKMTAVLCRHFGLKHIEIAEDIASDTFLKASEQWAIDGVPENAIAWLYTVAKNKTLDFIKRNVVFETQIAMNLEANEAMYMESFEFSQQLISDSELAMIFAVCNPMNSEENQICLALQILCGFSVEEIANAFLVKSETIKKRLHRSRSNLRNDHFQIKSLSKIEIASRLPIVLKTLYLMFNEGYFSKTNNNAIRKGLCSEATRLTLLLKDNVWTDRPQTNALLALMCFQSSRLEARINAKGEAILFNEQDKKLWDKSLIIRGNYYLVNATNGKETSKYHLEAGIAYWHTTENENKWTNILQLYNQLILIEYSPIIALNRTFAYAQVYGSLKAINEAEKLKLTDSNYYHALLGHLYSKVDQDMAVLHFTHAIRLTRSKSEKRILNREIERLNER